MRAVIQRVSEASVRVNGELVAAIGCGLAVLVAVAAEDQERDIAALAEKLTHLRVFPDEAGKMNRSLLQIAGELLLVPNFTLYGDIRKGRRPNFMEAAGYEKGRAFFQDLCAVLGAAFPLQSGVYGAMMEVHLVNDGPVTLLFDSRKTF